MSFRIPAYLSLAALLLAGCNVGVADPGVGVSELSFSLDNGPSARVPHFVMTSSPETVRVAGDSVHAASMAKEIPVTNFRFTTSNPKLPTDRVSGVAGLLRMGEARGAAAEAMPQSLWLTVPAADAGPWREWLSRAREGQDDANRFEETGALSWLAADGASLGAMSFGRLGIVDIVDEPRSVEAIDGPGSRGGATRSLQVELYVEGTRFAPQTKDR